MGFEFKEEQQAAPVEENLTQEIFTDNEEQELALQFLMENNLYQKFLLWCGIQDQLKKLKDSLSTEEK